MPMAAGSNSGSGKSGDVRAGGAFVEISARDQLTRTLIALKARAMAFGAGLRSIGTGIGVIGGVALAPLTALLKSGIGRAENINNMALAMGYSAEQMQRLAYAAEVADVAIDDVLKNPARFKNLLDEAPIMDAATIRESVKAQQEMRKTWIELQAAIAPLITSITPIAAAIGGFIRANKGLTQTGFIAGAALTALGLAVVAAGTAITAVTAMLGLLSLKVILVTGLVAGLGYGLFRLVDSGGEMLTAMKQIFGDLADVAGETVGGIVAALSKGDIEQAGEVAAAGLLAVWKRLEISITDVWIRIKSAIIDNIKSAINGVKNMLLDMGAWILRNDPTGLISDGLSDEDINAARDQMQNENNAALRADLELRKKAREEQLKNVEAEFQAAKKKLAAAVVVAKAEQLKKTGPELDPAITATRGAFRLLSDARQQFSESNEKKLLNVAEKQLVVAQEQVQAIREVGGMFKIR
jgi:hypothetical protein